MLSSDPHLAGGFFRLLGSTLAERITELSSKIQKAVGSSALREIPAEVCLDHRASGGRCVLPWSPVTRLEMPVAYRPAQREACASAQALLMALQSKVCAGRA